MTPTRAPQAITPALRQWIVEQARAGFGPEAVLQAMRASGWEESVARQALDATLKAQPEFPPQPPASPLQREPQSQPIPVPEPDLAGSPLYLDAGDRQVQVLQSLRLPRLVVFGDLLSADECDALIALAQPRLSRSLTVATRADGQEVSADRTSQGMFFERGETPLVAAIEARLSRLLRWPADRGEGLQVLRYGPGAEYKPHYDYFEPSDPGTATLTRRGGQRVATVILYLSEPRQGGGTVFPELQLEVAPRRGNAVFFSYDRPHPSSRTLHGGAPVIAGEKWIATKWLRERAFA